MKVTEQNDQLQSNHPLGNSAGVKFNLTTAELSTG